MIQNARIAMLEKVGIVLSRIMAKGVPTPDPLREFFSTDDLSASLTHEERCILINVQEAATRFRSAYEKAKKHFDAPSPVRSIVVTNPSAQRLRPRIAEIPTSLVEHPTYMMTLAEAMDLFGPLGEMFADHFRTDGTPVLLVPLTTAGIAVRALESKS